MPEAKPEAGNPGRTEKKRRKRQREGRRASHPLTEFGKTRESLGRRARGSSSAAPAFRTIRRRPATGLDERSKKSEGKRRKPPLGKPDRPGRNGNPTAGPKPANRFHPSEPEHGRRFPRSRRPQSKSKCAGDEDLAAPRRRDGRGRSAESEFRPDRRVFLPSSSHESSGVVPKIGIENRGVGLRATPEDRRRFRRKRKRRFEKTNRRTSETPSRGGSRVERALHEKPHALGKGLRPVDEHRGTTVDVVPGRNVPRTVGIG